MDYKRIKSICTVCISAIAVLFTSVVTPVMNVSASSNYYVDYAEPSTSSTQGYLSLLLEGGKVVTFFWNAVAYTNDGAVSPCLVDIDITTGVLSLVPSGFSNAQGAYYSIFMYDEYGNVSMVHSSSSSRYAWYATSRIMGYKVAGNVGKLTYSFVNSNFSIFYGSGVDIAIAQKLQVQYEYLLVLKNAIDISNQINQSIQNILQSMSPMIETYLDSLDFKLGYIIDYLDIILNELTLNGKHQINEIRTFVMSIRNELKNASAEDEKQTEQFKNDSKKQTDKMNELNKENKTDKIDVNSAGTSVDDNLDMEAVGSYGMLLSVFTGNSHIVTYLLVVFAVALISYVLFGKR